MKKRKIIFAVFILIALSLALISCGDTEDGDSLSLLLSEKNLLLENIDDKAELTFEIVSDEAIDSTKITWSTSDENVAVCENGVVRAVGYGICVIRANYMNVSASCRVKVWNPSIKFSLSAKTLSLADIGETALLDATELDGKLVTGSVSWSTSNSSIAVCQNGVVTAVGYGSCLIQASLNSQTVKCLVTVTDPNMTSVSIEESEVRLEQNEDYSLNYFVTASNAALTWSSSDEEIATCTDGKIHAKKKGVCVIFATTEDGKTDACVVTVARYKSDGTIPEKFEFDIPEFPKEVVYISNSTGQIASAAIITSYEVLGDFGSDGRYYIWIKLHGTKIYDIEGKDGTYPVIVSTNLYREEDVWCTNAIYKAANVKVGESFTIDCNLFTIALNSDGTPRKFYMVIDDAMQL